MNEQEQVLRARPDLLLTPENDTECYVLLDVSCVKDDHGVKPFWVLSVAFARNMGLGTSGHPKPHAKLGPFTYFGLN